MQGHLRRAVVGFVTSLAGVAGVFVASVSVVGVWFAFLSLPGLLISIAGLLRPPRRLASWGVALGVIGSLYVPTLYLSLFAFSRN